MRGLLATRNRWNFCVCVHCTFASCSRISGRRLGASGKRKIRPLRLYGCKAAIQGRHAIHRAHIRRISESEEYVRAGSEKTASASAPTTTTTTRKHLFFEIKTEAKRGWNYCLLCNYRARRHVWRNDDCEYSTGIHRIVQHRIVAHTVCVFVCTWGGASF